MWSPNRRFSKPKLCERETNAKNWGKTDNLGLSGISIVRAISNIIAFATENHPDVEVVQMGQQSSLKKGLFILVGILQLTFSPNQLGKTASLFWGCVHQQTLLTEKSYFQHHQLCPKLLIHKKEFFYIRSKTWNVEKQPEFTMDSSMIWEFAVKLHSSFQHRAQLVSDWDLGDPGSNSRSTAWLTLG